MKLAVGRDVAFLERKDGWLEPLQGGDELDDLDRAVDGADVLGLAALEEQGQAAPQDVEARGQLVGGLGSMVNMGAELVDEAEELNLGLCRDP